MDQRHSQAAPDVVVIGGGIVGASAAAHLGATGRRVVLVERDEVAAAASGRNSGVVQHPFDPVLVELYRETVSLYRALEEMEPGSFRLPAEPSGLLLVSPEGDVARRLADHLAGEHPGLEPILLEPDAARRLEPALAEGIAACRLSIGYPVAPAEATHAYAAAARASGVKIRTGRSASILVAGGRVAGVELDDGTILPTHDVVVAAGPWSCAIVDPSGSWRPIRPQWGVVVMVGLADPPRHVIEEAGISAEIEPGQATDVDIEPAGEIETSLVTAGGFASLGSTFLADEPSASSFVPRLVARGARFLPAIATAPLGAHRVCARPLSDDGRPLVGRIPGLDGLWIAAGHGPWGISTGPASGRLVADLIDGRIVAPPPTLDPARFGSPFD